MKPINTFKVSTADYSFVHRFIDLGCITMSLVIVIHSYNIKLTQDYIIVALTSAVVFLYIAEALHLYQSWRVGRFMTALMTVVAVFISSFLILFGIGLWLKVSFFFPNPILNIWFFSAFLCCMTWRILKHNWSILRSKLGINLRKMAILGATSTGANLYQEIDHCDELGFDFVGFFDDRKSDRLPKGLTVINNVSKCIEEAKKGDIDILFIALPISAEKRIAKIINLLSDTTVDVYVVPAFMLSDVMQGRVTHIGKIDALSIFESPYLGSKIWLKRFEDILVSLTAIILLSPVYMLIALILKITSPGPVLFKQSRYGLHGEKISVFKFRSMNVMETDVAVKQATRDDKRVTPFGGFLRRTSLDELPQFFNVLMGDMSVVGPRPHAVSHNEEYRKLIQFYMLRHHVKPGITGWAQVSGWRGETDTLIKMQKRVEFDLYYILQWSIWFDFKILMLTVLTCLKNENTY